MTKKGFKELKAKTTPELKRQLAEERERLRDLRFKVANQQHKDVRDIRQIRLTIARIQTILNNQPQTPHT